MSPDAYDTDAWKVIVIITACSLLSTVIVGLRFYVRLVITRKFGNEEWALAAALATYFISVSLILVCVKYGLGQHFYTLSTRERSQFLKFMWIASTAYGAIIMLIKATFLLQYRRVFPLPSFQRVCDIFLAFIAAWALAGTIGAFLHCRPLIRNWDPAEPTGCAERIDFWLSMGILHVISDVLIFLLPLPLLRTLPLPKLQKGVLMAVFSLGFFTCAISIIRLTTLHASTSSDDPTWINVNTVVWSVAEVTCAIFCACIPTLRPLLRYSTGWRRHLYDPSDLKVEQTSREGNTRMCES
ncbi:hypothetical protein BKA66DRAFT_291273 [Pyrenochaeta sp. MPI-SDFR-AT-0127]|nr:hypothetical protein BKA66DRAFT_291273 [Pyrenochaeta sp. MPI-SDFR-AT-0127]